MELHEHVTYRGRLVCSCGDHNCASLDSSGRKTPPIVYDSSEREALANAYPGKGWRTQVRNMSDNQVMAVYLRLKNQGKV